jgi:hypothetical protein
VIPNRKRAHDLAAGIAVPLWERRVSIGIGGGASFLNADRAEAEVVGDMDLGVALAPIDGMTIGLVGKNLLPLDERPEYPLGVLVGFRQAVEGLGSIALEVDGSLASDADLPLALAIGLEKEVQVVRMRAGYRYDGVADLRWATWGLGFENDKGAIEFSMALPFGAQAPGFFYQLGIRIHA